MKKADREVWAILADEIMADLCACCRFARFYGACEDAYSECEHPLWTVQDLSDDPPVLNCWGFRPLTWLTVSDWADIVGIILANDWDEWQYMHHDGQIIVSGRNSRKVEVTA